MGLISQKFLLPVVVTVSFCGGCSRQEVPAPAPRPALTYTLSTNTAMDSVLYPGEILARHEADQAFRIGGKITARLADQGTTVKKGQPLARLDPLDASLAADAAHASVTASETDARYAEAEYKRYQNLFEKGFISQSALDQKRSQSQSANARLASAQAQSRISTNQSAYTTLNAGQDGVITQVLAEVGQVVSPGQAVMRLANPAEMELAVSIPESKIVAFRENARKAVQIFLWAQPGKPYAANVREIGAAADPVTRTYPVRITLLDPDANVQLGMTGFSAWMDQNENAAWAVPLSSLYVKDKTTGVWRIAQNGKISLQPVTVLQYRETVALIKGNVKAGDVIVAAGVHKLREGDIVKPVTDPQVTGSGLPAPVVPLPR